MFHSSDGSTINDDLRTDFRGRFVISDNHLSLNIRNLSFSDDGNYTIYAKNIFGNDSFTVTLVVDGKQ